MKSHLRVPTVPTHLAAIVEGASCCIGRPTVWVVPLARL